MGEASVYQATAPTPRAMLSVWLGDAERVFFSGDGVGINGDMPCGIRARLAALLSAGAFLHAAEKEEKCKDEFTNKAVLMLKKAASDMTREKELRLWDGEYRAMVSFEAYYLLLLLLPLIHRSAVDKDTKKHLYTVLCDAWVQADECGSEGETALPYLSAFAELLSLDAEHAASGRCRYTALFRALAEAAGAIARGKASEAEAMYRFLCRRVDSFLEGREEDEATGAVPPAPALDLLACLTAIAYRSDDRAFVERLLRRARAYFSASGAPLFPVSEALSGGVRRLFFLLAYISGDEASPPTTPVAFLPLSEDGTLRFALTGFFLSLADKITPFDGLLPYVGAQKAETGDAYLFGRHRTAAFLPNADGAPLLLGATGTPAFVRVGLSPMLYGSRGEIRLFSEKTTEMKGGFLSYGTWLCDQDRGSVREACVYLSERPAVSVHLAVAALPDDETVLLLGSATAKRPLLLTHLSPLCLSVDAGDARQSYYFGGERHTKKQLLKRGGRTVAVGTHCLFSDALGVVSSQEMQLSLRGAEEGGCDCIMFGSGGETGTAPASVSAGEEIGAAAAAFAVGSIRRTYALQESFLTLDGLPAGIKSVSCVAANRKRYTLLFNLTPEPFLWEGYTLESGEAVLLSWDR